MHNPRPHMEPAVMSMDYQGVGGDSVTAAKASQAQTQSQNSPAHSQLSTYPDTLRGHLNNAVSGHSSYTESFIAKHVHDYTNMPVSLVQAQYFPSRPGQWPVWRGGSVLSPFEMVGPGPRPVMEEKELQRTEDVCLGKNTNSNAGENDVVRYTPSKKTVQRQIQRQKAAAFKAASEQWPMKIACSPKGEIPKNIRLYVHTQFRASARRFLKLSVIHFRDHPDSDLKIVKDDLDSRFEFNPPLRPDYMLWYIEQSLRTCRYLWRKYWVKTGQGEKHKHCPLRYFPPLVKYWKTAEAEEESKRMKEARNAAKKKRELLRQSGEGEADEEEDDWDVSSLNMFSVLYTLYM